MTDLSFDCTKCGAATSIDPREDSRNPYSLKAKQLDLRLCFTCAFWHGYVATKADPTHAIINGEHYVIGQEPNAEARRHDGFMLGFGGREHVIRFHDGRRVVTHNLWFQGTIPELWRAELPDNAAFEVRS